MIKFVSVMPTLYYYTAVSNVRGFHIRFSIYQIIQEHLWYLQWVYITMDL